MLTRKQQELLNFIHERLMGDGVSPSFDEMKDALKLKSKSGIYRLISGLEERGFIRRLPHRARALEIIRLADKNSIQEGLSNASQSLKDTGQKLANQAVRAMDAITLPFFGRIAAGTAIEALRDNNRSMDVPSNFVGRGDHYLLEVAGDSMIEAGIHDGDTVIIQQCDSVNNGDIAVALIDEQEVTLKSFYRKGSAIDLVPANSNYTTMTFPSERITIQGKLVGLMRKYH